MSLQQKQDVNQNYLFSFLRETGFTFWKNIITSTLSSTSSRFLSLLLVVPYHIINNQFVTKPTQDNHSHFFFKNQYVQSELWSTGHYLFLFVTLSLIWLQASSPLSLPPNESKVKAKVSVAYHHAFFCSWHATHLLNSLFKQTQTAWKYKPIYNNLHPEIQRSRKGSLKEKKKYTTTSSTWAGKAQPGFWRMIHCFPGAWMEVPLQVNLPAKLFIMQLDSPM